jgi:hypothetical protein
MALPWCSARMALFLAIPIEAGNFSLIGMMLTPDPLPSGVGPRILADEWGFFHLIGLRFIEILPRLLGTPNVALIVIFLLAYLQTALVVFLTLKAIEYFRARTGLIPRRA